MSWKSMTWKQKGLGVVGVGFGLMLLVGLGVYGYVLATMTPLHPTAQDVQAVTHLAPPDKWAAAVEQARQTVRASVAEQNLPGVSVAVGAGGELVWAEGFGWAHLADKVAVTPGMRFRIGTTSTVLTSAAAGLLIEKGRLNIDDEIQAYVPGFPKKEWPVTLRQVMGHMAGLRTDAGGEEPVSVDDPSAAVRCARPVDGLDRFAQSKLRFEPGTDYRFSSYGWALASAAIEAAAQQPFSSFMQTQVFDPLGMKDTTAESSPEPSPDRATFYFPRMSADPRYGPDEGRELDLSCFAGSAAFVSTPSDMVRFGLAINSGKLLQPATVQLLQTPQRLRSGKETPYGLGWDLYTADVAGQQRRVVGHDGELMGGLTSSFMIFPGDGVVIAVLSNTAFGDTHAIGVKIAQAFANAPGSLSSPSRK
jgi:serine beta-lactamase-like protein LACTB, mitochondrial